jgi:hypothetical protein
MTNYCGHRTSLQRDQLIMNMQNKRKMIFFGGAAILFCGLSAMTSTKPTKPVDRVHESFERMSNKCQQFEGAVTFDDKLKWARCMDAQLPREMYRW